MPGLVQGRGRNARGLGAGIQHFGGRFPGHHRETDHGNGREHLKRVGHRLAHPLAGGEIIGDGVNNPDGTAQLLIDKLLSKDLLAV